jgi:NAD(P)-dependent dehydrogenase (short-subunit alcohol dehydrogenase family)
MMNKPVSLITGANKGIGFEAARRLAEQSFTVLLGARDPERGQASAERLRDEGLDVCPLLIDVTDERSVGEAVKAVERDYGRLDVLVNNAGANFEFGDSVRPSDLPLDLLRATYETNVFGAFAATRAFLPLLRKGRRPRVINLSSTLGSLGALSDPAHPLFGLNMLAYNSSKTALNAITVSLAKDLGGEGIAVVAVCPGWVRTDMGGQGAPRSVEEGARIVLQVAVNPEPPTGILLDEKGSVAW